MDPIDGVLDQNFFKVASPTCLKALARLIDEESAVPLKNFLDSVPEDNEAAKIIREYLGEVIERQLFYKVLVEGGYVDYVKRLDPYQLTLRDEDPEPIIEKLEFVERHMNYVMVNFHISEKPDYDEFYNTCPSSYRDIIKSNKDLFYKSNDTQRVTPVKSLISMRKWWQIVLNGMRYKKYYQDHGIPFADTRPKEF